ncbi:NAD(P)H-dependent oxidoreductase [Microbacterium sp. BG28]|uniref:NAD(P)H-dependent oxidoreductase n=1 Tax=Microbacterium sp. BG28 TaxID=3097356 RepID=UPI002A5A68C8|nr:NAD(P)H-dependent oxidoreductase [Microbacterium sp. BG28]MDY0828027.1 NAD(P)H-dependent oxidoreductase [Microbacterium sp. BG28]
MTAHPDAASLTASLASRLADSLGADEVEVIDLDAEGFDPRFRAEDRSAYRGEGAPPADVRAYQRRLDEADQLILLFPVYWWSMPALMKGWIDRVFINGWAFDIAPDGGTRRRLGDLTVHLFLVAGDAAGTYDRHGYEHAILTQIVHGIVDYCGARRGGVVFLHESESEDESARRAAAAEAIERSVAAVRRARGGDADR